MCFWGFFHTRHEELYKKPSKNGGRVTDPTLEDTTAFDAGNDAKILGNAAVSKFTFCIQGLALSPFLCSFLRGLKAVDKRCRVQKPVNSKLTICRAGLLSNKYESSRNMAIRTFFSIKILVFLYHTAFFLYRTRWIIIFII